MQRLRGFNYLDAHAILICFAVELPETFRNAASKVLALESLMLSLNAENVHQWYEEVSNADVPIFLVGCKCDLRSGYTGGFCFVSRDEAEMVASRIGARGYHECSAYSSEGLDRLIDAAARASLERVVEAEDEKKRCVVC
jgi:GTPase SAR1 family protein